MGREGEREKGNVTWCRVSRPMAARIVVATDTWLTRGGACNWAGWNDTVRGRDQHLENAWCKVAFDALRYPPSPSGFARF